MTASDTDQQLVQRAQRGDLRAFDLLVLKYQARIGALVSRYVSDAGEVEDVTQEAFIKAYRALDKFRGDSAFYTWLYRIATNEAIYYSKKNKWKNRNRIELDQLNQSTVDINERSSEEILNILNFLYICL